MVVANLDALVAARRVTGYTIEEDTAYLAARRPTLTYRMYADGPDSHRNLGEFASAISRLALSMRLSRLAGVVAGVGGVRRSRQLCLTAELAGARQLDAALGLVARRFTVGPAAAPGSWRYPDVRVTGGGAPDGAVPVFAHLYGGGVVVLTPDDQPPVAGARTFGVGVHASWLDLFAAPAPAAHSAREAASVS
jgi:hypothetical protein